MTRSFLFCMLAFLGGCSNAKLPQALDHYAFQWIAGTLITSPDLLTMKEIHLDNASMIGREIIIEGQIDEMSEHYTYMVLSDDTARMLVVLTDLETSGESIKENGFLGVLRVLGSVESGKKGLPYVLAKAVNVLPKPKI